MTDTDPTNAPSASQVERAELRDIRSELREKQDYIRDNPQLWAEVSLYLQATADPPAESLPQLVWTRLGNLQTHEDHKMHDHRGVDDPEDAYPDDCEGCPHYGSSRCPVLADKMAHDHIEYLLENIDDENALEGKLMRIANRHHCHIIKGAVNDWSTSFADYLEQGHDLRERVVAEIHGIDRESIEIPASMVESMGLDPDDVDFSVIDSGDVVDAMASDEESEEAESGEDEYGTEPPIPGSTSGTPEVPATSEGDTPPPEHRDVMEETLARLQDDDGDEEEVAN